MAGITGAEEEENDGEGSTRDDEEEGPRCQLRYYGEDGWIDDGDKGVGRVAELKVSRP